MPRLRNKDGKLLGEEFEFGVMYNLGELEREGAVYPPTDWGPWTLNTRYLVLTCEWYEVDLARCLTSAQALDWIFQVAKKSWADDAIIAGLIRALNDVLDPQANLCPMEKPRELTAGRVRKLAKQEAAERKESLRVYAGVEDEE